MYTLPDDHLTKSLCVWWPYKLLLSSGQRLQAHGNALGVSEPRYNAHYVFRIYRTWQVKGRHGRISHMGVHPTPAKSQSTSLSRLPQEDIPA
jgi:hypothetical protein